MIAKNYEKKLKSIIIAAILILVMTLALYGCNKPAVLNLSGTIESAQIDCNSEVAGKVVKLEKDEGTFVKEGDVIAVLDSSLQELVVKQQEAMVKLKLARLDELKAAKGSSSQAVQAAEADLEQSQAALDQAELIISRYRVKAPVSGTLLIKNVEIGDMVNAGTNVGTLSDLSDLWINVYIRQKNLKSISLGQELDLSIQTLDNRTVKGKITYISNQAEFTPKNVETDDAKENTVFKVKIKILDNMAGLKPGMTANVIVPLAP
ncbi:MAG: efflux RND transporter periplasmic adaptor subunit [Ruminiclostridium sp.]|nr:efflux RND transporter periplasmic adaptor subunit [Ruminiclostridium sp.]